jgi:hypothetical protein
LIEPLDWLAAVVVADAAGSRAALAVHALSVARTNLNTQRLKSCVSSAQLPYSPNATQSGGSTNRHHTV